MKLQIAIALTILGLINLHAQENAPEGMVLVPGGSFLMGSDKHQTIAAPRHPVTVKAFYMDVHEVSNQEYEVFCRESGHRYPEFWGQDLYKSGPDYPHHPVLGVSFLDATEYASWAGKRLPSEAEWEYAARGGLDGLDYPYGEKADHSKARFNDPHAGKGPVPVGSYEPNAFGLCDMSGNVWEWVSDWFSADYYAGSPEDDPAGPGHGTFRVLRGGGWHSGGGCASVHRRNALPPGWVDFAGGFRCVKDVDIP